MSVSAEGYYLSSCCLCTQQWFTRWRHQAGFLLCMGLLFLLLEWAPFSSTVSSISRFKSSYQSDQIAEVMFIGHDMCSPTLPSPPQLSSPPLPSISLCIVNLLNPLLSFIYPPLQPITSPIYIVFVFLSFCSVLFLSGCKAAASTHTSRFCSNCQHKQRTQAEQIRGLLSQSKSSQQ